jgi:hypothetical protein
LCRYAAGAPSPTADDVASAAAGTAAVPAAAAFAQSSSSSRLTVLAAALGDTESAGAGVGSRLQAPLTLTLSGLKPASRYDVYVVARDFRPSSSSSSAPELGGAVQVESS